MAFATMILRCIRWSGVIVIMITTTVSHIRQFPGSSKIPRALALRAGGRTARGVDQVLLVARPLVVKSVVPVLLVVGVAQFGADEVSVRLGYLFASKRISAVPNANITI